MTAEQFDATFWERVRTLFHAAVDLAPGDRGPLFDDCEPDASRRGRAAAGSSTTRRPASSSNRSGSSSTPPTRNGSACSSVPIGVVRQLGHGGMGTVFLASREDDEFEQRVAIKLVRRGAGGESILQRFRQERQILAALEHPNIARLLDGGTTSGGRALPGHGVRRRDTDRRLLPRARALDRGPAKARGSFSKFCEPCRTASQPGHPSRLKPANILVTQDGDPKASRFWHRQDCSASDHRLHVTHAS